MSDEQLPQVPMKLQATTMNYSTLTRSLTPADGMVSSDDDKVDKRSGYFNNANNSSMAMTNNQTQASAMLNQTHYNSNAIFGGHNTSNNITNGGRAPDNASYLHPNQSSVLMNYQTAGVNQSVMTNDRSLANWADQTQVLHLRGDTQSRHNVTASYADASTTQISGMGVQGSPPGKENSNYGQTPYVHA